jgi:hypothetical protein
MYAVQRTYAVRQREVVRVGMLDVKAMYPSTWVRFGSPL